MELKSKDVYKIECQNVIGSDQLFSLAVLYAPLLSANATKLYCFLAAEANRGRGSLKHERICQVLNLTIMEVQQAREQLEQLALLKTYYRAGSYCGYYNYQVWLPLLPAEFLKNDIFGRMYAKLAGVQQYEQSKQMSVRTFTELTNYEDISKPFSNRCMASWDEENESEFHRIRMQENQAESTFDLPVAFDYDLFFKDLSYMAVPASVRNKESLKVIGELAVLYGIDPVRMGFLVSKSVHYDPLQPERATLDETMLRDKCRREHSSYVNPNLPKTKYDIAPIQFLQKKQNGVAVTASDARLLEYLVRTMRLDPSVTNVLIEYVLSTYDMKLPRAVTEKIAASWVRLQIKTVDQALEVIRSQSIRQKGSKPQKEIVPQWKEESSSEADDDEAKRQQLQKLYYQRTGKKVAQ